MRGSVQAAATKPSTGSARPGRSAAGRPSSVAWRDARTRALAQAGIPVHKEEPGEGSIGFAEEDRDIAREVGGRLSAWKMELDSQGPMRFDRLPDRSERKEFWISNFCIS